MAIIIENGNLTADSEEELRHGLQEQWSGICSRAASRAALEAIQVQRWERGVEGFNKALLVVAASLTLVFPLGCLMLIQYSMLAYDYISKFGTCL